MIEQAGFILISGVQTGCIYALLALSYYVIIRATGILNFAQGEFMMLAAVFGAVLLATGIPLPLGIVLSIAGAMLAAVLAERFIIGPLQSRQAPLQTLVVALLGIMIVVRYSTGLWFGRLEQPLPSPVGTGTIPLGGALLMQRQTLLVFVVTALVFIGFALFMRYTTLGASLRVTAIDRIGAQLCGIDPRLVRLAAFAIGGLIAGIVGWLYAPLYAAGNLIGVLPGIKGFMALVIGGLGSSLGSLAGGMLLGLLETLTAFYISSLYSDAIGFAVLLIVLVARPSGLISRTPAYA